MSKQGVVGPIDSKRTAASIIEISRNLAQELEEASTKRNPGAEELVVKKRFCRETERLLLGDDPREVGEHSPEAKALVERTKQQIDNLVEEMPGYAFTTEHNTAFGSRTLGIGAACLKKFSNFVVDHGRSVVAISAVAAYVAYRVHSTYQSETQQAYNTLLEEQGVQVNDMTAINAKIAEVAATQARPWVEKAVAALGLGLVSKLLYNSINNDTRPQAVRALGEIEKTCKEEVARLQTPAQDIARNRSETPRPRKKISWADEELASRSGTPRPSGRGGGSGRR